MYVCMHVCMCVCACVCVCVCMCMCICMYVYVYVHVHVYVYVVKGSFWACVFAYVFYTCFSLHSAAIFSATHDACQTLCAVRKKKGIRNRIQYWTGTAEPSCAARMEDIPSPLPLRIQVLRENDLQGRHQLRVIGHFPCESEQRRSRECTGHRVARRGAPLEPDQFL